MNRETHQLTVFETDDAGVESTLVVDTHYTVNDVGTDGGGTIDRSRPGVGPEAGSSGR